MSVPLAYLGVMLIWSTTPLAIKWSGEGSSFLFGVTGRMAIGLIVGLLLMWGMRYSLQLTRRVWPVYLAVGVSLYVSMISVYFGAQYVSSGLISVLYGLTPIFTAVIARLWLGERHLNTERLFGIMLGIGGLYLLFKEAVATGDSYIGVLAILFAVLAHAFGGVWYKAVYVEEVNAMASTVGGLGVATPLFTLTWLIVDQQLPPTLQPNALWSMVYLGIFGSVIGAMLFFFALRRVGIMTMSLLTLLTPVMALAIGYVLNGEVLGEDAIAGVVIILLGLIFFQMPALLQRRRSVA